MLQQLSRYPDNYNYFGPIPGEKEPVQGDAWQGLIAFDFDSGERESVIGMILSNSCDIAAANNPDGDQRVVFAPLIDMELYAGFLREEGKRESDVQYWLTQVRRQEMNRIFYVPAMHGAFGESLVLLDTIHSMPVSRLTDAGAVRKFSLNLYGWYVFLVKLSIHFTRTTEGIARDTVTQT